MTLTEPTPLTAPSPHVPERDGRREPEPFGPGSILWDDLGMYLSAVAGNSAFILQSMHPAIGTVVDRLSSFRADPVGRALRSFASVQTWVYGGQEAIAEGRRLREMHKPLSAEDENGTRHHALSAEPWAWVHLTGYYAADTVARRFSPEPLTPERERRLFEEFMNLGRILQVPERMLPATIADFWTYFDRMVADTLVPHRVALEVLDRMDKVPPTVPGAAAPPAGPAEPDRRAPGPLRHRRHAPARRPRQARAVMDGPGRTRAARPGHGARPHGAAAARARALHAHRLPRPPGRPRPPALAGGPGRTPPLIPAGEGRRSSGSVGKWVVPHRVALASWIAVRIIVDVTERSR
ncbi:oxygenase MpaB family protein [Actinomadura kijaniata]